MGESGHIGEYQAPPIERRFAPVEVEGRNLRGVAIRYGDIAHRPFGRETFEPGAFGDVSGLDVRLNVQHVRDRLIARTPQTLTLTDGPDALRVLATLPETREANDALALVRAGVLRGLSLEFRAGHAPFIDGVRTVKSAGIHGLGLVDTPAYPGSHVEARAFELRQDGDGLTGRFMYDVDTVVSDRAVSHNGAVPHGGGPVAHVETRQRAGVRKSRVRPGAFRLALEDADREIQLLMGADYDRPLASKLAGTLDLQDGPEALAFSAARLPDTSYVRDFRASLAEGAAVYGVRPLYRIPAARSGLRCGLYRARGGQSGSQYRSNQRCGIDGISHRYAPAPW